MKKHIHHSIKTTLSFSLLMLVAAFLAFFLKPSVTGAAISFNPIAPTNKEAFIIILFILLIFFVTYALHLEIKKK